MKQQWQIDPVPPPGDKTAGLDGLVSFALLAFVVLAPLIYFGPELHTVEAWIVDMCETLKNWLEPLPHRLLA